jgi:hypothetical protein
LTNINSAFNSIERDNPKQTTDRQQPEIQIKNKTLKKKPSVVKMIDNNSNGEDMNFIKNFLNNNSTQNAGKSPIPSN